MSGRVLIGTRGSALALTQTRWIAERLRALHPGLAIEIRVIKTKGDKILDVPLAKIGDKGLFVKELENALLSREVDLAVHSLKDLPTQTAPGLAMGAVPVREDPRDVLILPAGTDRPGACANPLDLFPAGARVGSSSLRRRSQLLHHRPDLRFLDLRGNLDTRLRKLDAGEYDAIVLAAAGLERLGWADRICARIPHEICLPAVGQGALAVECRADDEERLALLGPLDDPGVRPAVEAERAFMRALEGGCQVPLGAYARTENGRLVVDGMIADLSGQRLLRHQETGALEDAESIGERLAAKLLDMGGAAILEEVRARAVISWSEPDGGRGGPED